jgi:hypothetical protein
VVVFVLLPGIGIFMRLVGNVSSTPSTFVQQSLATVRDGGSILWSGKVSDVFCSNYEAYKEIQLNFYM